MLFDLFSLLFLNYIHVQPVCFLFWLNNLSGLRRDIVYLGIVRCLILRSLEIFNQISARTFMRRLLGMYVLLFR